MKKQQQVDREKGDKACKISTVTHFHTLVCTLYKLACTQTTHAVSLSLTHKLSKKHVRRGGIMDWAMKVLICLHLFFPQILTKRSQKECFVFKYSTVYSCTK